jgi:cell division protein FtsB
MEGNSSKSWGERIAAHRPEFETTDKGVAINDFENKSVSEAQSELNDLHARLAEVNKLIETLQSHMMVEFTRDDAQLMERYEGRRDDLKAAIKDLENSGGQGLQKAA